MHISKLTYQILTIFIAPKIHTNLLWDLTFLFLILGAVYFLSIFFFRNRLNFNSAKTKGKRQELAPIISNFLFHSPEDPKQEQKEYVELKIQIREYLSSRDFRRIISQILFDLQKDVAGATRERLFKLYKELELHHDSFQKLESWRWETVAQGILELSQMEVEESYQLIKKFINDRRGVVRKQAELATVGLRPDGINYLLDTTRHSLSEWQQLKLIEILSKIKNYRPPHFKAWLLSQNKDVVLFALRLIKHYNQKGAELSIIQLVRHKNEEIKIAAIQCIIDFNFYKGLETLKKVFWKSSNLVKINILNAIGTLGEEIDILFLQEVAQTEGSFIIVGKAQSTINSIRPETILPTKDILELDDPVDIKGEDANFDVTELNDFDVDFEVVASPIPESIEVEDLEFFDEIEIPEPKKKERPIEPFEPAFELNPIEEEYGVSMDHLLGLVSTNNENFDSSELVKTYDGLEDKEKDKLLGMMQESGDTREIPLLEHIAENEMDSELRFKAFKTLQSISQNESVQNMKAESDNTLELPLAQQSIFYSLYKHASDEDSRLILLKELMDVGDNREIPFLNSLLNEPEVSVVKLAEQAIAKLESLPKQKPSKIPSNEAKDAPSATPEMNIESSATMVQTNQDDRIPMELLFLYEEMGIGNTTTKTDDDELLDFELSNEFFSSESAAPKYR